MAASPSLSFQASLAFWSATSAAFWKVLAMTQEVFPISMSKYLKGHLTPQVGIILGQVSFGAHIGSVFGSDHSVPANCKFCWWYKWLWQRYNKLCWWYLWLWQSVLWQMYNKCWLYRIENLPSSSSSPGKTRRWKDTCRMSCFCHFLRMFFCCNFLAKDKWVNYHLCWYCQKLSFLPLGR